MGLDELKTLLSSVYPTAYWSFPEKQAPPMPYLVFFEEGSNNFGADNRVYHHTKRVSVELLTKNKDTTAEAAVEAALDAADIFWEKTETHIDDEDAYEVIYEIEV